MSQDKVVVVSGAGPGLGREIADAVLFLASDLAPAVTGQRLDVNGGEFHH